MKIQVKLPPRYEAVGPKEGDVMEDGTTYLGYHGGRDWFAAADFGRDRDGKRLKVTFDEAAAYAKNLTAHGHSDWIVPPGERDLREPDILKAMFLHLKNKGSSDEENALSCWSSTKTENKGIEFGWVCHLKNGVSAGLGDGFQANVRCVRAVPRKWMA